VIKERIFEYVRESCSSSVPAAWVAQDFALTWLEAKRILQELVQEKRLKVSLGGRYSKL
jgi:hypothetical protein